MIAIASLGTAWMLSDNHLGAGDSTMAPSNELDTPSVALSHRYGLVMLRARMIAAMVTSWLLWVKVLRLDFDFDADTGWRILDPVVGDGHFVRKRHGCSPTCGC